MTQLHQILAAERDVKKTAADSITNAHHVSQKADLFNGLRRTYTPFDDGDIGRPAEGNLQRYKAIDVIAQAARSWQALWDLTLTKDEGNTAARADVTLEDGTVIATNRPATWLLWMEKQLDDLATFVDKLPVLDPTVRWEFSPEANTWESEPVESIASKKVQEVIVKYPATDKHPAQTEMVQVDKPVGRWTAIRTSGALPAQEVAKMKDRVTALQIAFKQARARANQAEIVQQHQAESILDYVFGAD
jgi:hypothetical protein